MREGWVETTLGDVAEVLDRMRKPISSAEREKRLGGVPYYGATGQTGWIDTPIFDEELVLLGEDAIDFLNPDVHKAYLISGPSWVNNHAHVLRAKQNLVLSFFLMEALNAVDYSQFVAFGTRSKLTQGSMMGISINLPSLVEQRRIVDLVSSVDSYIDSLQSQVDAARTARNAVADEAVNAGYSTIELCNIGRIVTGSTPSTKRPEYWEPAEVDFITAGDFGRQLLIKDAARKVSREGANASRTLGSHSVLQVCIGATIGKVGYVSHEVVTNQQINSVAGLEELDAYFVALMLATNELQANIGDRAGTTTLPIISKSAWGELTIPWPDVSIRESISGLAKSIDEFILETEWAVVEAKKLRSGLLSDLLSGEHEIPTSYDKFIKAA